MLPNPVEPTLPPSLPPSVRAYFLDLNGGQLQRVAAWFQEEGVLHSPLDGTIRGQGAILDYLGAKTQGMICYPETVTGSNEALVVLGRVRCPAFWVRVQWTFCLTDTHISSLRVQLLASPQELLKLSPL